MLVKPLSGLLHHQCDDDEKFYRRKPDLALNLLSLETKYHTTKDRLIIPVKKKKKNYDPILKCRHSSSCKT